VIKQDIVNRVAEQLNITKVKAEIAVESVFNSLKNALKRGERIELRGFGVFIVKPRKSGVGRNPRTGEEVAIPPGKTIRFKPAKKNADKIVSSETIRNRPVNESLILLAGVFGISASIRVFVGSGPSDADSMPDGTCGS
jgi:DNA-binding protein HU-beta